MEQSFPELMEKVAKGTIKEVHECISDLAAAAKKFDKNQDTTASTRSKDDVPVGSSQDEKNEISPAPEKIDDDKDSYKRFLENKDNGHRPVYLFGKCIGKSTGTTIYSKCASRLHLIEKKEK